MADYRDARIAQLEAEVAALRERGAKSEARRPGRALAEALEQQTATAEILHVIASAPTVALPVLEAILHSATRLVASTDALIHILDGEDLRTAGYGVFSDSVRAASREVLVGRRRPPCAQRRRTSRSRIVGSDVPCRVPECWLRRQACAAVNVPLLREGEAIGVL